MVFPYCPIVKILLDFKKSDRFKNLLEDLRSLTWDATDGLDELLDFFDRDGFPIVMVGEELHAGQVK